MSEENTQETSGQPKRKVTVASKVKVIFQFGDDPNAVVETVNRDVFSVMDAITARLANTKSKEEMEAIKVSVHSFEDSEKSDPLPEGESPWEGPYLIANCEVEDLPIPDAMNALVKVVIPNDQCLLGFERLAEQLFLRSRVDGLVVAASFDGIPATVPLITPFHPVSPASYQSLYRTLIKSAELLREWVEKNRPEEAKDIEWVPGDKKSGLVTAAGTPVEERGKDLIV